jgi:hypothetical protein
MLVADHAFRLSLQRPLLQDTKILDERLSIAPLNPRLRAPLKDALPLGSWAGLPAAQR